MSFSGMNLVMPEKDMAVERTLLSATKTPGVNMVASSWVTKDSLSALYCKNILVQHLKAYQLTVNGAEMACEDSKSMRRCQNQQINA